MMDLLLALTLLAALGSGLIAGLFFVFSAFMMTALARLGPSRGIAAMQSINVTILNPWFFAAFFGTAAACVVLAALALVEWQSPGSAFLLAGSVLYLLCSIGVTLRFNVPLNDALAATQADSAEGAELWTRYLSVWTAWNHVRTVGSLLATASLMLALH